MFKLPNIHDGQNIVTCIHREDLATIVFERINKKNESTDAPFVFDFGSFYSVASDGSQVYLRELLNRIGASDVAFSSTEEVIECLLEDTNCLKWSTSITVPQVNDIKFSCGLTDQFKDIWQEFLDEHKLQPIAFVITGPPGGGKTTTALSVAKM
jgi:signal recognition particle GTPase